MKRLEVKKLKFHSTHSVVTNMHQENQLKNKIQNKCKPDDKNIVHLYV